MISRQTTSNLTPNLFYHRLFCTGNSGHSHDDILRLSNNICSRAQGLLVWVKVVVNDLSRNIIDGTPVAKLQEITLGYPEELNDLYELTISRIPQAYQHEAEVILKVLLSSRSVLSLEELFVITQSSVAPEVVRETTLDELRASIVRTVNDWLASRSGGLVEIIKSADQGPLLGDPVQLIHQTVQDFIRRNNFDSLRTKNTEECRSHISGSRSIVLACRLT
jgi:hypothetical protein